MKLQLQNTTLVIVDCVNAKRAVNVLEHCKSLCDFGATKILTSIPIQHPDRIKIIPLNTLVAYSIFMLTRLYQFVDTDKMLIVQRDGWVLNPDSWDNSWNSYDFIGPIFIQYPFVGSGGFSFRSKRIMKEVAKTIPEWDGTQKHADEIQATLGYYEDGVLCLTDFAKDFNIAPLEVAAQFAQGGYPDKKYYIEKPFGFHGNIQNINHETGFVSPVCSHNNIGCDCTKGHQDYLQKMAEDLVK